MTVLPNSSTARRASRVPLLAVLVLIPVLLAVWFYATPYLVLRQMRQAIDARDAQALSTHVDFPALRSSLKSQFSGTLSRHLGGQSNPLAMLGAMIGAAVAGPIIDAYATPAGVAAIMSGLPPTGNPLQRPPALEAPDSGSAAGDSGTVQASATSGSSSAPDDSSGLAAKERVRSGYRGFNEFTVSYPRDDGNATYTAIFHRSGLADWKLSAIDLGQ